MKVNDKSLDIGVRTGRAVLITGGAGGIGRELAGLFALDSYDIVLVDMDLENLEYVKNELANLNPGINIMLIEQDLTIPEAAERVYEFTKKQGLHVSVLVNCAGFGTYGPVQDMDHGRELNMLQLHVLALYRLTRLYLNDMIGCNEGHIINMSSISAFQPNPFFATYGASKSFVLQFSRALSYELKEQELNVKVLAVCPTAVKDTGFKESAGMEGSRTFSSWMAVTARDVAIDTYRAMKDGRDVVIPGKGLGLLHCLISRLPAGWLMKMSRSQLKDKRKTGSRNISGYLVKKRI